MKCVLLLVFIIITSCTIDQRVMPVTRTYCGVVVKEPSVSKNLLEAITTRYYMHVRRLHDTTVDIIELRHGRVGDTICYEVPMHENQTLTTTGGAE